MIKINSWKTVASSHNQYRAPETIGLCLFGKVSGHPRFVDGEVVRTSRIESIEGRVVSTVSGSVYRLGTIDPLFRRYLKIHRPLWDWRNPITVL